MGSENYKTKPMHKDDDGDFCLLKLLSYLSSLHYSTLELKRSPRKDRSDHSKAIIWEVFMTTW